MKKAIIVSLITVSFLMSLISLHYKNSYEQCISNTDTVYVKDIQIIEKDAEIIYKTDTLIVNLFDTIYVRDTVAQIDTVMNDGAEISVMYSYWNKVFDIGYKPPKSKIKLIKTKKQWYDRFGVGVGIGTDFKNIKLELQIGYYITIGDL